MTLGHKFCTLFKPPSVGVNTGCVWDWLISNSNCHLWFGWLKLDGWPFKLQLLRKEARVFCLCYNPDFHAITQIFV